MSGTCSECKNPCDHISKSYLTCSICMNDVHLVCLQEATPALQGDVFFTFSCKHCSPSKKEVTVREKIPWINIILIALYNLHTTTPGLSNHGYFHWKMHIADFISKNWKILLGNTVRRKKSWMGTVSGTLSHYSPVIFLSGTKVLKDLGWWKLTRILKPKIIIDDYYASLPYKKLAGKKLHSEDKPVGSEVASDDLSLDDTSRSSLESWSQTKPSTSTNMYSKAYVEPSETLSDCLFADDMEGTMDDLDVDIEYESADPLTISKGFGDFLLATEGGNREPDITFEVSNPNITSELQYSGKTTVAASTTTTVAVQQELAHEDLSGSNADDNSECSESEMASSYKAPNPPPKSLFNVRAGSKENFRPWVCPPAESVTIQKCIPMSEFEEIELLNKLHQASSSPGFPPEARRLYRKLSVRCLKRRRNMAIFDLDGPDVLSRFKRRLVPSSGEVRLLDRFQRVSSLRDYSQQQSSFIVRLMGQSEPSTFYSPYTQRVLMPYIRRDTSTTPLWLRLMNELVLKANKNSPSWKPPERWPIDYCYVRPQHIASVNSLCCEYFYPGVDLSECLTYPDFSCVALYKKLVIGFAFMVPDVGYNETYISFLFTRPRWRKSGIASFMLYHLIQTCMGKDVTLHVSVTNPAIILYQKFGFKVEEFVQDFYDKYLPADSTECKHALFLRLCR